MVLCHLHARCSQFAEDSGDDSDDVNPSANCQHGDDAGCLFDLIPTQNSLRLHLMSLFTDSTSPETPLDVTTIDQPKIRSAF